jgi:hypothetical protein
MVDNGQRYNDKAEDDTADFRAKLEEYIQAKCLSLQLPIN